MVSTLGSRDDRCLPRRQTGFKKPCGDDISRDAVANAMSAALFLYVVGARPEVRSPSPMADGHCAHDVVAGTDVGSMSPLALLRAPFLASSLRHRDVAGIEGSLEPVRVISRSLAPRDYIAAAPLCGNRASDEYKFVNMRESHDVLGRRTYDRCPGGVCVSGVSASMLVSSRVLLVSCMLRFLLFGDRLSPPFALFFQRPAEQARYCAHLDNAKIESSP